MTNFHVYDITEGVSAKVASYQAASPSGRPNAEAALLSAVDQYLTWAKSRDSAKYQSIVTVLTAVLLRHVADEIVLPESVLIRLARARKTLNTPYQDQSAYHTFSLAVVALDQRGGHTRKLAHALDIAMGRVDDKRMKRPSTGLREDHPSNTSRRGSCW